MVTSDGPAASQFAGWLAAFNQGDRAALLSYHQQSFPYSAASQDVADIEREIRLSGATGGFEIKKSEGASATTFSAILKERGSAQYAHATMQVDARAPHRVVSFEIHPIPTPVEFLTSEAPLDNARRRLLIEEIARVIAARYVFPDVGRRTIAALREHVAQAAYDNVTDGTIFADKLTGDLQRVSHDLHLRVFYGSSMRSRMDLSFGIGAIERLQSNVARIVINGFFPVDVVREPIAGFMTKVADADALIIDLRENHGGDPSTVGLVASYLFDEKPVHLNDMVSRDGTTQPSWTEPNVAGMRFGSRKPVYVLTSAKTISGGEELAYDLQCLHRATLVGETTSGAANLARPYPLDDWFVVTVPGARAINPITKTNWEGVGVRPDIAVSADSALDEALSRAVQVVGGADQVRSLRRK